MIEPVETGGRRVALYGGSFNPPHIGHVQVVCYVLATA
ncbi:MAG: nicotinic acid mononucleotide adenylyltransferase, partial [Myxococcota bacterium]